jgi:hypothetical protein
VSDLSILAQNIQELDRLKQLNYELLEELEVLLDYMHLSNFPIPDREKFNALLSKTHSTLTEIHCSSSLTIQFQSISRRKVTATSWKDETDGEVTEPERAQLLNKQKMV